MINSEGASRVVGVERSIANQPTRPDRKLSWHPPAAGHWPDVTRRGRVIRPRETIERLYARRGLVLEARFSTRTQRVHQGQKAIYPCQAFQWRSEWCETFHVAVIAS